eukprot:170226_1
MAAAADSADHTLAYSDALGTLNAMFADIDDEVISMVLDSNGGHMERTVECLLQMSGAPPDLDEVAPSPVDPESDLPVEIVEQKTPESADSKPDNMTQTVTGTSTELSEVTDKDPGYIPDDFLRPPGYFHQAQNREQIHQDQVFAQMIQDQELMQEFHQNPDSFAFPGSPAHRSSGNGGEKISEKLSKFGASTKQKFASLAEKFSRRRRSGPNTQQSPDTNRNYSHLSDKEEPLLGAYREEAGVELRDMRVASSDQSSSGLQKL